jgi:hypothetical protein
MRTPLILRLYRRSFSLKSVVASTNWLEALREKRFPPPSVDRPPIGLALKSRNDRREERPSPAIYNLVVAKEGAVPDKTASYVSAHHRDRHSKPGVAIETIVQFM